VQSQSEAQSQALSSADDTRTLVSIVVPCLNEELVIGEFVDWCHEGLRKANVAGEILIIDSSSDRSAQIARERGATVIEVPKRGLGQAYIDAVSHIQGKYVIMGDADLTYDFRDLSAFVAKLEEGYEFVMGNRFAGQIEAGAMPALHRYFGTPLTTALLNVIYGTRLSDIHCGMRALTTDALKRIHIQSRSWQYASEMIIKAVHLKLRMTEVPIAFYKDREGRLSHVKRGGWMTPWYAGWITLQTMFTFGADFFLILPGIILLMMGLLIVLPTSLGPVQIGPIGLSLYWMLAGMTASVLGLTSIYMGTLARVFYDFPGERAQRYRRRFHYNRSVGLSAIISFVGMFMTLPLLIDYFRYHLALPHGLQPRYYLAVTGLLLIIGAFLNFVFTLLLHAYLSVKEYWK